MTAARALGENVRSARKAKGLTQEQLANRAGRCLRTIQKIESGENKNPEMQTLEALAPPLGKTAAELLGQKEASKP